MEGDSGVAGAEGEGEEQRGRAGEKGEAGVCAGPRWLMRGEGEGRGHDKCEEQVGGRIPEEGGLVEGGLWGKRIEGKGGCGRERDPGPWVRYSGSPISSSRFLILMSGFGIRGKKSRDHLTYIPKSLLLRAS